MEIKAVIIEDEFKVREVFTKLLNQFCPDLKVVGEAGNIHDGYDLICSLTPHIVFLDIEMPGGNGFELLSKFANPDFEVIFVTSYGHYAIKAIKFSALDYLLKPVIVNELKELAEKIKRKINNNIEAGRYKALINNLQNPEQETLVVSTKTKTEYLPLKDILYLMADGNYTIIELANRKVHVAKTLKEYDELLCIEASSFIRIHRKYILNKNYIKEVSRGDNSSVILINGSVLEISRRKKMELADKLQ